MKLHENKELFSDAIVAASRPENEGGLGIKEIFIEKDYWITRSLQLLSKVDPDGKAVFKGGTSLSKAYEIGARFSEDIDIAILDSDTIRGNQLKTLIRKISKGMSEGLEEFEIPGATSKGSHYHKAFYSYPRVISTEQVGAIKAGQILIEISAFGNPYPFERRTVQSFLSEFFVKAGQSQLLDEYDMHPFEVSVLDKRRTLTEKLVSLFRCSFADDYVKYMSGKIRHFYDLNFLFQDSDIREYMEGSLFKDDFNALLLEDQRRFDKPEGWQNKLIKDSPLVSDLHSTWVLLQDQYSRELPDLAYRNVPSVSEIEYTLDQIIRRI